MKFRTTISYGERIVLPKRDAQKPPGIMNTVLFGPTTLARELRRMPQNAATRIITAEARLKVSRTSQVGAPIPGDGDRAANRWFKLCNFLTLWGISVSVASFRPVRGAPNGWHK
jgi:hypothetical protein